MVEITGVNIDRVVNGRIAEHGGVADLLGPLLAMGALAAGTSSFGILRSAAAIAIDRAPLIGRTLPSSASSPTVAKSRSCSGRSWPVATSRPKAIGRSKPPASFLARLRRHHRALNAAASSVKSAEDVRSRSVFR